MSNEQLAVVEKTKREIAERGIPPATWNVLVQSLYPGANPASVLLVWDYCQARKLDPLKKPVHIVPMRVKIGDQWQWRDQILPGIYEYRITAHRTGEYLGHDEPIYGPEGEFFGVKAPAWCKFTVYRWNEKAKMKVPYTVTTHFVEVCGTKKKDQNSNELVANGRWERAPIQMFTKCSEAAPLREAFPEELGGTPTAEEIEDHMPDIIDVTGTVVAEPKTLPSPALEIFMKVAEPLRDKIERGFATLKLTEAQRLVKINQTFGPNTDPDEVGEALYEHLKNEFAAAQGRPRESSNAKKPANEGGTQAAPRRARQAHEGAGAEAAPQGTVRDQAVPPAAEKGKSVDGGAGQSQAASGKASDQRGAPTVAETFVAATADLPAHTVVKEEPMKAADVPWGGAKPATSPKDVSEYF